MRLNFSISDIGVFFLCSFLLSPILLKSIGCSIGKWQREQIQKVSEMTSKKSENFLGLGINAGASNWITAESDARLEAEAALAENIQVYVKTMNRFVTEKIEINDDKQVSQTLNDFILSISEVNLRMIEYSESGRLCCDSKYYVAVIATKNRSEYFKDYVKLIPTSATPLLNQLFQNADKEYFKELESKFEK
jgi:hypothetical protein